MNSQLMFRQGLKQSIVCIVFCCTASAAFADGVPPSQASSRCGWFDNSSPQNASLTDRDGEWVISQQGGHSAQGTWPPKFAKGQWVSAGSGSYGYGCACMKVTVDREQQLVLSIMSSQAKPLAVCRRDRQLKGQEPGKG
jgi:Protein of unknown function (DUF4087)